MDIIDSKILPSGKLRVVMEVEASEGIVVVRQDAFYRLGEPFDEVVQAHIIEEAQQVVWCPIEQKWVS